MDYKTLQQSMLRITPAAHKVLIPYTIDRTRFPTIAVQLHAFGFDLTQPYAGFDIPDLQCHIYQQPPSPPWDFGSVVC